MFAAFFFSPQCPLTPCVWKVVSESAFFFPPPMNGDSVAEASSRHSTVCEAKIKKCLKKTGNQKLCWKNTNLLELQCCQRIGGKKKS